MNVETKANVGDTIYFLKRINRVTCPLCNGDGKIILTPMVSARWLGERIVEQFMNASLGIVNEYDCHSCDGQGT